MSERYTRTAIVLHWLTAALIILNVGLVWTVDSLPEGWARPVIDTHKSTGITVLGLVLMRILWRWTHRPPPLPADYAPIERTGAHVAHYMLYALMILLPLSGWVHDSAWKDAPNVPMHWYGLFEWPRIGFIQHMEPAFKERFHDTTFRIHGLLAYGLYALFTLHVAGALKHQWIDRHAELQRMGVGRVR